MNEISFVFDGRWVLPVFLDKLSKIYNTDLPFYIPKQKVFENGFVEVIFDDDVSDDIEPKAFQINALNFIMNNQNVIQEEIFKALPSEYAMVKELYYFPEGSEDSELIPVLDSSEDLYKALSLNSITIKLLHEKEMAYTVFDFECSWGDHGCEIAFLKDKLLSTGGFADTDFESLVEDKEMYKNIMDGFQLTWKINSNIAFKPNEKYGTLKPYQISHNKRLENSTK
jgi:hypothetical protein